MSRSKNSYEIRALSFLKQFAKYVDNWESVKRVNYAVNMFNMKRHRKVEFLSGATRLCVVTSDYVIKWDRRGDSKYNDCEIFGGCRDEVTFYYNTVVPSGFGYMFCRPTWCFYNGIEFEIMPRVKMPTNDEAELGWEDILTEAEQDFVNSNLIDVETHNWGWFRGQLVFYDYAAMA